MPGIAIRGLHLHSRYLLDKYGSICVKDSSPIPRVPGRNAFAIESYNRLSDVPVRRDDCERAGDGRVAVLGLMKGPPRDDDPPILDGDRQTEHDSPLVCHERQEI
jgi:hypothetical protein